MRGPEGAAELVRAWLTDRLPARLRLLEQSLGLDPNTLPDPAKVVAFEDGPLGLEDWPAVYVLPQRMTSMTLTDVEAAASEVYRCTYALRVLAWVRADSYADTDQLRKRYALAIREALLERKTLTDPGVDNDGDSVDPGSFREDYSDVMVDAARTIAGAWVDLVLITSETVTAVPPPLGTMLTTGVTVGSLPAHPGLS